MPSYPEPLYTRGFFALVVFLGLATLWGNWLLADWMPFAVYPVSGVL